MPFLSAESADSPQAGPLFPKLFVILNKLSSEYQSYACGNFFRMP